ncbi:MAG: hypothetical protein JSV08_09960 [Acidobacteriota bacterium]|nr:MAG: hypothetical protein JSV08_09960 [Acidobacteriota bacterium]
MNVSTKVWLAMAATVFLTSGAARADYVVILKDGSAIMAEEPFRVENGVAIMRTSDAQLVSVAAEHVDVRRTEEANAPDVVVVDRSARSEKPEGEPTPSQPPREESAASPAARTVDNYELRKYRNIRINASENPVPWEAEEGEEEEEKASTAYKKSDLLSREEELRKMVDSINTKVEEANSRRTNLAFQKRMEKEIEEMRENYQKEWDGYAEMVNQYNAQQYASGRPPSSTEAAPGAGEEAEEETETVPGAGGEVEEE